MWEGIFAPNLPAFGVSRQRVAAGSENDSVGVGCMDVPLREGDAGIHHDVLLNQTRCVIDLLAGGLAAYLDAVRMCDMVAAEHYGAALADAVDRLREGDLVLHARNVHELVAQSAIVQEFRTRADAWRSEVAALKGLVQGEFAFEPADLDNAADRRKALGDVKAWLADGTDAPSRWSDILTNGTRLRDLVTKKPAVLAAELAAAELGRSRSALEKLAREVDRVRGLRHDEILMAHRAKRGPKPKTKG